MSSKYSAGSFLPSFKPLKGRILVPPILLVVLESLGIGGLGSGEEFGEEGSCAGEEGSYGGFGEVNLVLSGCLAVHLSGRVLLLAVERAYEGVGSVRKLFIK